MWSPIKYVDYTRYYGKPICIQCDSDDYLIQGTFANIAVDSSPTNNVIYTLCVDKSRGIQHYITNDIIDTIYIDITERTIQGLNNIKQILINKMNIDVVHYISDFLSEDHLYL